MILLIVNLLRIFEVLIIIRVLFSWFHPGPIARNSPFQPIVHPIDQLLRVFRVLIPVGNAYIDLGPILAIVTIQALERVLVNF